jgi:hypothetical protein
MKRWVAGLALALVLIAAQLVSARNHIDLVPSYEPLRQVVKPASVSIDPDAGPGHVVVKFKRGILAETKTSRLGGRAASTALQIVRDHGLADLSPTIQDDVGTIRARRMAAEDRVKMNLPDLSLYFETPAGDPAATEEVIRQLNALDEVEIAYFAPKPEVASKTDFVITPSWETSEDYIEAAPGGVGARAAWTLPGGDGTGIQIIDIEFGWQLTHEDLSKGATAVIIGVNSSDNDHGTAVMGEMLADRNGFGMTGISQQADFGIASVLTQSTAQALYNATAASEPGDLLLIELHAPGPHYDFDDRDDQLGYVAMEYWQDNFDAIVNAYAEGVIVCEAAGNGAENFDSAIYDSLFTRAYRNSHAIICGAAYPPSFGSHDRSKLGFSNYGSRVDLQGYGTAVYSTGYGDLYAGSSQNEWYTSSFGGTSSASPIVTGSVAALSGVFKQMLGSVLNADSARNLLVATGSPQMPPSLSLAIGPRPNLVAAIGAAFEPVDSIWYSHIELPPGEKAALPVMLSNSHPVNDIYFPFKLTGPPTIFLDSLTLGTRTIGLANVSVVFDNRFAGEIGFRLRADVDGGSHPLEAGSGEVARLWVRTTPNAISGQVEAVDSAWLGSATRLRLVSYFDDGYPDYFSSGSITIAEPPCDCPHQGDYDEDNFTTAVDLGGLIDALFAGGDDPQDPQCVTHRGDLDCDGFTTALDLSVMIDFLFAGGTSPCDPCL